MKRQLSGYKIFILALCAVFTILPSYRAYADTNITCPKGMSQDDCESLYNNWVQWVPDGACNTGGSGGANTGIDSAGTWNSGLQPPYILEQFAIETLKDIAQKRGVDASSAVTQDHVIALVAFMIGEGGDIENQDLFNPLNTGLNAPDLIDGAHSGDGVQSFKSFDAGVEATARTMVGSNQSRLADTLINPTSTAEDFMGALTYYTRYPGNAFWAAASLPPNTQTYYNGRISLVNQVRNNYANLASIELGTPVKEEQQGLRDPTKLQFHPTTDTGGGSGAATNVTAATKCAASTGKGCGSQGLQVPPGGSGTSTCYFNQADLKGGGYDWQGCGCLPTSLLIIRSTLESNPSLSNTDVLTGLRAAGGIYTDGCSGVLSGGTKYLTNSGYTVTTIKDPGGATTDAHLNAIKTALTQGELVLTHTSTSINSAGTKPTDGHFLVIYAVDAQGNFYVANPGDRADNNKAVTPERLKAWLDSFYAVKKGAGGTTTGGTPAV